MYLICCGSNANSAGWGPYYARSSKGQEFGAGASRGREEIGGRKGQEGVGGRGEWGTGGSGGQEGVGGRRECGAGRGSDPSQGHHDPFPAAQEKISNAEVDDSIDRIIAGMEGNPIKDGKSKSLVAYHEVGHALCATLTPGHDPVQKVTLVPRGQARGLTWFIPGDDPSLVTKGQLQARIVGALGGRAAEEVVFGEAEVCSVLRVLLLAAVSATRPPCAGSDLLCLSVSLISEVQPRMSWRIRMHSIWTVECIASFAFCFLHLFDDGFVTFFSINPPPPLGTARRAAKPVPPQRQEQMTHCTPSLTRHKSPHVG